MEKTVFRRGSRGDDAVAATAVRTRHADHDRVRLDGFVAPDETPRDRADRARSFADRLLDEYCDGSLDDVTMIRHYVRGDLLPEAEFGIGEACREHFAPPDLPGTVMAGVSDVVGGDRAVTVEMEATIPHDHEGAEVAELPPPPGYTNSAERSE